MWALYSPTTFSAFFVRRLSPRPLAPSWEAAMGELTSQSTAIGTVIAYDSGSDTCTVELTSAGVLDQWISGVPVAASINRAYAVYGATCTLDIPDPHRPAEWTITAIQGQAALTVANTTGPVTTKTGSATLQTDANGNMAAQQISFPSAFSAAPTVYAGGAYKWTISGITTTSFDVTLTNQPSSPNTSFTLSWSAEGQA